MQARPHAPQFVALVERSASQPLDLSPSQLAKFVAQFATHCPFMHAIVALGAVPHAMVVYPEPLSLQRCSCPSGAQVVTPGEHTCVAMQSPPVQSCPLAQFTTM